MLVGWWQQGAGIAFRSPNTNEQFITAAPPAITEEQRWRPARLIRRTRPFHLLAIMLGMLTALCCTHWCSSQLIKMKYSEYGRLENSCVVSVEHLQGRAAGDQRTFVLTSFILDCCIRPVLEEHFLFPLKPRECFQEDKPPQGFLLLKNELWISTLFCSEVHSKTVVKSKGTWNTSRLKSKYPLCCL